MIDQFTKLLSPSIQSSFTHQTIFVSCLFVPHHFAAIAAAAARVRSFVFVNVYKIQMSTFFSRFLFLLDGFIWYIYLLFIYLFFFCCIDLYLSKFEDLFTQRWLVFFQKHPALIFIFQPTNQPANYSYSLGVLMFTSKQQSRTWCLKK